MENNNKNSNDNKPPFGDDNFKNNKNLVLIIAIVILSTLVFFILSNDRGVNPAEVPFSELLRVVKNDPTTIESINITENRVEGVCVSECPFGGQNMGRHFFAETDSSGKKQLLEVLDENPSSIVYQFEVEEHNVLSEIIFNLIPWLLIFGVLWFIMFRQIQGSGNKALSFGKSRAKLHKEKGKKITFEDVAGVEEAKEELQEVIEYLKDPVKFRRLGAKIPKGVLLMGPPGTGKTLLARACAGEANRPFFSMSGSDFVEMFVGVGASRVRDLFEQGKKNAPCILFIDELDAVGRTRGAGYGGGHDEREQTLNQMLVEMDGFETDETVIVMAATNRPDVLDPALLRPGRFDRQIVVNNPDVKGREGILKVHAKKIPLSINVDFRVIAKGTPGFSGADLANLVNEAALIAARRGHKRVAMTDFEYAKDKVLMGPERRSIIISDKEKILTAYHEAGHAILGFYLPNADPVHKVTIIPRGRALGVTQFLPEDDKHSFTKAYLIDRITMGLGGRVSEELKFGLEYITNGAANDLEMVTKMARAMITEWGMSEKLGTIVYGQKEEPIFIGKEIARHKDYSDETAKAIDTEIHDLIISCYNKAKSILQEKWDQVETLSNTLIEREALDAREIKALLNGQSLEDLPRTDEDAIDEDEDIDTIDEEVENQASDNNDDNKDGKNKDYEIDFSKEAERILKEHREKEKRSDHSGDHSNN